MKPKTHIDEILFWPVIALMALTLVIIESKSDPHPPTETEQHDTRK